MCVGCWCWRVNLHLVAVAGLGVLAAGECEGVPPALGLEALERGWGRASAELREGPVFDYFVNCHVF